MKYLLTVLLSLLASTCLSGQAMAQDTADTAGLKSMVESLNTDIAKLKFLVENIESSDKADRMDLVYRLDERSFRLLADFDRLIINLSEMPDETPHKAEMKTRLAQLSDGVGEAVLDRVAEITQHITEARSEFETLSGGALISAEAFIHSLESVRFQYFEALINHLDRRETLGLSTKELRAELEPRTLLYAESLAGSIELTTAALVQIRARLRNDPENAEISAALFNLESQHKVNVGRLEALVPVLVQLELDSSEYQAVLLTQADRISINYFSSKSLSSIIKSGWTSLTGAIEDNAPDIIFRLLVFVLVLLIFRALARLTKRVVRAASDRSSLDMSELLKNILVSTSGGIVMATGVLMALSQVGISLAPMLAGLGVAGFIVGFALQDTLGNFAAGAMILIYRPFDVDDFVEVTGASGLVRKMNLVSTTITTFDNQTLVVPNSKIWGDVIKNVTAQKQRRVDLEFGIGYDDDIEHAERIFNEVVTRHEKVLKDPEPMVHLHTLGDSSVNFIVRPWVRTDDYWEVYWDLMREVKLRLDQEGISIPFPQRDVHLFRAKDD